MWYVCQICTFCTSANNTEMHFWMLFVMLSFVFFGTAKTMHYNHQWCQWQNLVHIYAVCQYQIIVEIIIWISVHNMYVFFSVACQLLLTCVQHGVVPSVLNPAHTVMSMIVNDLHQVFSKTYIQRSFLCWQRESPLCTFCTTPQFITCIRCWEQKMDTCPLCS